jgi:hypothetical protein
MYNHEFPDWFFTNSPEAVSSYEAMATSKVVPNANNYTLYLQKSLLVDVVGLIQKKLDQHDHINLVDLYEVSVNSSLPFLVEFLDNDQLGGYVSVSQSKYLNEWVRSSVNTFMHIVGAKDFKSKSILANPDITSFKLEMEEVSKELNDANPGAKNCNLFTLMNSCLGNLADPARALHNIHESMQEGDYLVVLQGIYRPGTEHTIVSDYRSWLLNEGNFLVTKSVAKVLNPAEDIQIEWVDDKFRGVNVYVKTSEETNFAGLKLPGNSKFTLLRSSRFVESELMNLFKSTGFKIIEVSYDSEMTTGVFLMQKA